MGPVKAKTSWRVSVCTWYLISLATIYQKANSHLNLYIKKSALNAVRFNSANQLFVYQRGHKIKNNNNNNNAQSGNRNKIKTKQNLRSNKSMKRINPVQLIIKPKSIIVGTLISRQKQIRGQKQNFRSGFNLLQTKHIRIRSYGQLITCRYQLIWIYICMSGNCTHKVISTAESN